MALFGALLLAGAIYIVGYNSYASKRHEIKGLKERLLALQTANVDLKDSLFRLIDPARLEQLAGTRGLVLEQRPQYLVGASVWLSDSSH